MVINVSGREGRQLQVLCLTGFLSSPQVSRRLTPKIKQTKFQRKTLHTSVILTWCSHALKTYGIIPHFPIGLSVQAAEAASAATQLNSPNSQFSLRDLFSLAGVFFPVLFFNFLYRCSCLPLLQSYPGHFFNIPSVTIKFDLKIHSFGYVQAAYQLAVFLMSYLSDTVAGAVFIIRSGSLNHF